MADKNIGTDNEQKRDGAQEQGGPSPQPGPSEAGGRKGSDESHLDPSAPGETGTTPGTNGK